MSKKIIRKIKKTIGDVVEIPTSRGLTYVQYTHQHTSPPVLGSLIRVLEGFYQTRPAEEELKELVNRPHRFQTFCPVHHTVNLGVFELIGTFPVPKFAQAFPVFKSTNAPVKTSPNDAIWWLWDGEKSWRVGKLSEEEQLKYPFHSLCDASALSIKIERGASGNRKLC